MEMRMLNLIFAYPVFILKTAGIFKFDRSENCSFQANKARRNTNSSTLFIFPFHSHRIFMDETKIRSC